MATTSVVAPAPAPAPTTPTATPYSFADALPIPAQIGVRRDGSFDGIMSAVAGTNYYVDALAFGQATGLDTQNQTPLGLRSFIDTGMTCSNGQRCYAYNDTTPQGNLLGQRVATALTASGLPGLRGLAPGIMEDARDALDPAPLLLAAAGSGVPVCVQQTSPVGDAAGNLRDPNDASTVWITDPDVAWSGGAWQLTRWVQATDSNGLPVWAESFAGALGPGRTPCPAAPAFSFTERTGLLTMAWVAVTLLSALLALSGVISKRSGVLALLATYLALTLLWLVVANIGWQRRCGRYPGVVNPPSSKDP